MTTSEHTGEYERIKARRAYVDAHKVRTRPYLPAKTHRITVNCATGERIIESEAVPPPVVRSPVRRKIATPTVAYKSAQLTRTQQIAAGRIIFAQIRAAVESAWDIPAGKLIGTRQTKQLYEARYASYKLVRHILRWSSTAMAEAYGRRDHTGCLAGLRKADALYASDPDWRQRYNTAHDALVMLRVAE